MYFVSLVFGLSQGGIVPSYALIVREFMPAGEAGARVGMVMASTIVAMSFGGWLSAWIADLTGNYRASFINSIVWNIVTVVIAVGLLMLRRPKQGAETETHSRPPSRRTCCNIVITKQMRLYLNNQSRIYSLGISLILVISPATPVR